MLKARNTTLERLPWRTASVVALVAIWWLFSFVVPGHLLPGPAVVGRSVVEIVGSGEFLHHMAFTVARVGVGFVLAMLLSLSLGISMGIWRVAEKFLEAQILIGLTIPALCWSAIAVMLFGLGEAPAVFCVVVIVTPMITVNILAGMKALDRQLVEMAKVFRADRTLILQEVVFPQLLPYVLAGSRYGLGLAWKVVVIAEMMGLSSGVGYQISYWYGMFSLTKVFAWTLAFSAVMFVIEYAVIRPLESRWTRWQVRAEV